MLNTHRPLLIAFDFDGTLYPLRPYDSEQRLMLKTATGTLKRIIARRAVLKDMKGMMHLGQFTDNYMKCVRNAGASVLDEVADDLCALVSADALEPLRRLKDETGAEFCIISCGTVDIMERYLEKMNVRKAFGNMAGKTFNITDGKLSSLTVAIRSPQDKVEALNAEIGRMICATGKKPLVIAVGDGPTDIPMLQSADFGILIDWDRPSDGPDERNRFPLTGSIREVRDLILAWLEQQGV